MYNLGKISNEAAKKAAFMDMRNLNLKIRVILEEKNVLVSTSVTTDPCIRIGIIENIRN